MGVTDNDEEQQFAFNFEHDGAEDIVSLTGNGYQVEAFGRLIELFAWLGGMMISC